MGKAARKPNEERAQPELLKGWQQIASFLGEPVSVVQHWATEGMPAHRQGRFVSATDDEVNSWLRRESGKPVDVVTDNSDLTSELRRGLAFVQHKKPSIGTEAARLLPKRDPDVSRS